jgi:hypothetical protein
VIAALAVFAVCYPAIAAGRVPGLSLDRPTSALAGGVLMVATGVLRPPRGGRRGERRHDRPAARDDDPLGVAGFFR